ncbi:transmembrane protein 130 [Gracilinanus agilis]|uniref:transmembrane protein 130 n=1 Tax=Gracilinanus agilis TaxID=191870 RepID=UPI001CFED94B|nr:transmembrane protein 130 [Gracilinanus agilis]
MNNIRNANPEVLLHTLQVVKDDPKWQVNVGREHGYIIDAIRSVQVLGLNETQVRQSLTFSLHITGSLPVTLCWLIKPDCVPLEGNECHLVVINSTSYTVNHTFKDPGEYCLSVRVQNGTNQIPQYYLIKVLPSGIHPALFALPCVFLISGMLGFIIYVTYRHSTQQKDLVEVADFDFSPMSDKSLAGSEPERCCMRRLCCVHYFLPPPSNDRKTIRESLELLHPFYKPVKSYSV